MFGLIIAQSVIKGWIGDHIFLYLSLYFLHIVSVFDDGLIARCRKFFVSRLNLSTLNTVCLVS